MNNVRKIRVFKVGFTMEVASNGDLSAVTRSDFYEHIVASDESEALDKFRYIYRSIPGQYQEKIVNSQEAYDVVLPSWHLYCENDIDAIKDAMLNDPNYMHDEFAISLAECSVEGLDY